MKPNKLIHHFQRTDSSLDRQTYIRLFADLYDLLTGEQKEVLRFINQLTSTEEYDRYMKVIPAYLNITIAQLIERNLTYFTNRIHPNRHDTFDDVYPLLLDVLSAKEKIGYINTMNRKIIIDDMLNDLDEN